MKLYTVVVHNLQMRYSFMHICRLCNSISSLVGVALTKYKGGGGMYLVSATPTKLLIEFL
jgi:hypothetical protein